MALSADGTRLASASSAYDTPAEVKVWDATTGDELFSWNAHTGEILSVAFSADGTRLASGGEDKTVKVWDATNGLEMLTLRGHTHPIGAVTFCADGTRLASASSDGTVKVWDARPWTPELRDEREALSLIHFLRDQGKAMTEWPDAIAADQTISELVRERALQFAREWK